MYCRHLLALIALASATACSSSSPTAPQPPPAACTYNVTTSALSFGPAGGSATVTIGTTASCSWTVAASAPWVTVASGASGSGPATVNLAVAPNEGLESRQCTILVAGQSFPIAQAAAAPPACSYGLDPTLERWPAQGGSRTFAVATGDACAWTAVSSVPWVTVTAGHSGTGPGTVAYHVAEWTGAAERQGTIQVADREFLVRQEPPVPVACSYSVYPVEIEMHWHAQPNTNVTVTTGASCGWSISAGADWIDLPDPGERLGPATVFFTVGDYTEATTRSAPLLIRWPTPTEGQNVWIRQEGCYYALGETARTFPATGGSAMTLVIGTPVSNSCKIGCPWVATSSASWIRITSGSPGAGDDYFFYTVDPNLTGQTRMGTIQVRNYVLVITQSP